MDDNFIPKKVKFHKWLESIDYVEISQKVKKPIMKRTIFYSDSETQEGYIIGEKSFYEGIYDEGCKPNSYSIIGGYDDYDPPSLVKRKRFDFYMVVVGYNDIKYVLKKHIHEINN